MTLPEASDPDRGADTHVNLRKLTPEEIQQREKDAHPENLTPERLTAWMERKEKRVSGSPSARLNWTRIARLTGVAQGPDTSGSQIPIAIAKTIDASTSPY